MAIGHGEGEGAGGGCGPSHTELKRSFGGLIVGQFSYHFHNANTLLGKGITFLSISINLMDIKTILGGSWSIWGISCFNCDSLRSH